MIIFFLFSIYFDCISRYAIRNFQFVGAEENISGHLVVSVRRGKQGAPEEIGRFEFDLGTEAGQAEVGHLAPIKPGHSVNARVTVENFNAA